jgi:SPP1 family predicted phage head-tail adaptor
VRGGRLQERIEIQTATKTANTSGQMIRTWAAYKKNWPAYHTDVSGGETYRGRQISAQANHLFVIRTLSGVTTKMRVLWGGVYYGIANIKEPFTGEMWLECKTAE